MTVVHAIVLGIVQGLTEFLPISSSAHLVLIPWILNWNLPEKQLFVFDVLVQLGTLVAVIVVFWRDLAKIISAFFKQLLMGKPFATHEARLGWLLIVATVPAGLAGLFLSDLVERAFSSPLVVGVALLFTAGLMILAEGVSKKIGDLNDVTLGTAIVMGLMQALALFPGISRSGSTISGGMLRHLDRESAGRFSFLMSVPIMLAAGGLSTHQMVTEVPNLGAFLPVMAVGFVTALGVGYLSIRWLLRFLVSHSLVWFAAYCAVLGGAMIVVGKLLGN